MIGYIGLVLLLLAYLALVTKYSSWFIPIDILASILLTIHAIELRDIPFMVVNGMIVVMLIIKYLRKEKL